MLFNSANNNKSTAILEIAGRRKSSVRKKRQRECANEEEIVRNFDYSIVGFFAANSR